MSERRSYLSLIAVTLLVLAACGSSDDDGSAGTAEPVAARSTTSAPSSGGEPEPTAPPDEPDDGEGEDRSGELLGRWEITNYVLPGGGLTNVVGTEPVFIEFGADGSVSYHTGCNAGGSTFTTSGIYAVPTSALDDTPEGQPITIGPGFQQTEIGCEGFLGDQDRDLPIDLGAATRFTFDGDVLRLLDEFVLVVATRSA